MLRRAGQDEGASGGPDAGLLPAGGNAIVEAGARGNAIVEAGARGAAACEGDSHWLLAWIHVDRGDNAASARHFAAAASAAVRADDPVRRDIYDAAASLADVFRDLHAAQQRWQGRFDRDVPGLHPAARGWIDDVAGTTAFQASDFARAITLMISAFDVATMTGQVRRAINLATNIGNTFTSLNAHHAALEWMQRGLDLARPTGWPFSIGLGLMQTAETLRQLGQRDAARDLLVEALATLAPLSDSRAYAVALEYSADVALDSGDHAGALANFQRLEQRGAALGQAEFQSGALRGQAHALSHLERPQEALARAHAALVLAREHSDTSAEMATLKALADIHAQHQALPAPQAMRAATPALHYLLQALTLADTIDGYIVPGATLDALAREYAQVGDYARAYEVALDSVAAREQIHSQEATNRAIAMQVQFQTERAQTEGAHHRQLAAAEARRAEALQQISATLEHLSAIGQEITTHLETDAVFRALDRHVHGLLDATHFAIFLIDHDGTELCCAFGIESGQPLPATCFSLSDPHAVSARCVRERREILIDAGENEPAPALIPGTATPRSVLFAPLQVGERMLGAMTVQSLQPQAYGERERLIFRTLCAYGAIALDNASAYRQIAATQAELLDKNLELEKAYQALEEVSLTDQLTGLRNRRFFLQHVDADIRMSLRRYDELDRPVAVTADPADARDLVFFMVDLDHFKEVNDRHGHAAGDAVLVQMQERLREVFRESDYLVRWGGEEFLVLARATRRDEAHVVAERIRRAVADRPFVLPDGVAISKTCSIGFSCFPFVPAAPRLLSWSEVVELADQALYRAKNGGRNAWAALYSTPTTPHTGLFAHLMEDLERALAAGDVSLVSSLTTLVAAVDARDAADAPASGE